MQASIRVSGEDFTYDLFNKLKTLVDCKNFLIKIEVDESHDETEYLMSSDENHKNLIEAIERIQTKENLVTVSMDNIL